jgi:hypothetical protein
VDATEQFVGAWAPSGLKDSTPGTGTWRASPRAFVAVSDCRLQDETTSRRRLKMMSISLAKPTQAPATTSGPGAAGAASEKLDAFGYLWGVRGAPGFDHSETAAKRRAFRIMRETSRWQGRARLRPLPLRSRRQRSQRIAPAASSAAEECAIYIRGPADVESCFRTRLPRHERESIRGSHSSLKMSTP